MMVQEVSSQEISPTFTLDASQADQRFVTDDDFITGTLLLRHCSTGDSAKVLKCIDAQPLMCNFKDYDGRTALHVAASEGRLELVVLLLDRGASPNHSDRWGGSPLDDAMRHRHTSVTELLRKRGGRLGSSDHSSALIIAASRGDFEEVNALILDGANVNQGDYDRRTPLHLACSEGQMQVVSALLAAGANVNAQDRWGCRPVDDARHKSNRACEELCIAAGSVATSPLSPHSARGPTGEGIDDALHVEWADVVQLEKIGAGAFGDIWKCRWRGTLVAAKMLKAREGSKHAGAAWLAESAKEAAGGGGSHSRVGALAGGGVGGAKLDPERDAALADLKTEIGLLGQLRHPNICLLLGYSLANGREVMISELMKCSLLDVLKTVHVSGVALSTHRCLRYAIQFAQGMNYLHTCKPFIVHRDLKPANLLLDFSDTLKVADFGLAKLRPISHGDLDESYVMTGETGSYRFMAPEVFRHEAYGRPVDVYSFAMITYNMLVGEPPWPELPGLEAAKAAALTSSRPDVPRHWDANLGTLLRSCWADAPRGRPSFMAVLEVLNEVFQSTVGTSFEDDLKGKSADTAAVGCGCLVM